MRIAPSRVIASTIIAAVLIGILVGFQIPAARLTTPKPAAAQANAEAAVTHPPAAAGHAGGAAMKADPVMQRGQQIFTQYCATCHGPEGKGDGISGQSLPIKPQNLSEGRQLNPLPDRFLFDIIAHGGQTVGLSPLMPGFKPYLSDFQIKDVIVYIRSLAQPPFDPLAVLPIPARREGAVQPIFFSHVIHAGSMQIACQYCHANARRSSAAGIPSVERCMGCHKIVSAEGNPEVQKLHRYWERKEPIPWVRVFKVPEYAQFTHKPHVQAGLQCQTCHGRIETMEQVAAQVGQNTVNDLMNLTGMSVPPTKLTMGWCVECHRSVNASGVQAVQRVAALPVPSVHVVPGSETKQRIAPLECVTCHH
jgi:mono/diheme cytochrome c family protein